MQKSAKKPQTNRNGNANVVNGKADEKKKQNKPKKKIASYSLDVSLLQRIRKLAHQQDQYYSSVVSQALEEYIHQHTDNQ